MFPNIFLITRLNNTRLNKTRLNKTRRKFKTLLLNFPVKATSPPRPYVSSEENERHMALGTRLGILQSKNKFH